MRAIKRSLCALAAALGTVAAVNNNWPPFTPTLTGNVTRDFPASNPGVFSECAAAA
jgi:hypothetical protein